MVFSYSVCLTRSLLQVELPHLWLFMIMNHGQNLIFRSRRENASKFSTTRKYLSPVFWSERMLSSFVSMFLASVAAMLVRIALFIVVSLSVHFIY